MQEFADSTLHSNVNIRDDYGYTMAALNDRAVVLANPPEDDAVKATVCGSRTVKAHGEDLTLCFSLDNW